LAPQPDISTRILAGSRIVMQIHYNTLAGDVTPDYSSFDMMLQSEPTPFLAAARPILLPGLFAPAHEPEAVNEHLFKNYTDEPITIVRLGPHMHLLGSRYRSDVVRADGSIECAIEIPDWDFNWQEGYRLPADEPIVLEPGDGISLQCTYDNSEANQPSTNGVIADPQDVHWGEGTRDEMCMNYLTMVEPYTPSESANGDCGSAGACLAACPEGRTSVECLLDCDDTLACYGCALTETVGCATACVGALITLTDHWSFGTCYVNRMALGSSLDTCLAAEAPEAYEAFAQCAHTFIAGGECNEAFTSCGMVLEEPATEPPG